MPVKQPCSTTARAAHPPLPAADFARWQALIEQQTGVVISAQSQGFLQLALEERMRELGIFDPSHYYQRLIQGQGSAFEWSKLLAGLTVQETAFFRDPAGFDFLSHYLKQHPQQDERALMLWSVGCASGEEAYSLAITASEALGKGAAFGVLGSDINESALAKARAACYSAKRIAHLPGEFRQRYFSPSAEHGGFVVNAELAAKVCFTRLNVLALADEPFFNLDVIVCQNLLIYFRRERRFEILDQLARRLSLGGVLLIGTSEATGWQHPALAPAGAGAVQAFIRKQPGGAE
ncbi:hypothetical protein AXE65_07380 [Ventosimonas gracilis]|uniref:protein-glutamate O-methyltransferase n=1 Tax=Ventosimonas gracilis TaxID=1680762 RepID=A0A139SIB1_9GAMM|nr:CheR family methyltransferase [Ventosimonas gracilis]KXU34220.1 hypothetical protein AXE65_07380 [Ventosimonas gracilis]